MQLNEKLFNVKINDGKVVITVVATVLLGKFRKVVLTALIYSEFEILMGYFGTQRTYVQGY